VRAAEDGIVLAHGAEGADLAGLGLAKGDGDAAGLEVEGDGCGATKIGVVAVQPGGGAEGGMAGEGELFLRGEDADVDAAFLFDREWAGEDEGGFGEVGFAGDLLHVIGGEAARVGEDGEGVAFEGALGEDVGDGVGEFAGRGWDGLEVWLEV